MSQSDKNRQQNTRRTVRADYTRSVLDESRQLFMETCIRKIKAAGIEVRGSREFELEFPVESGPWDVVELEKVFTTLKSKHEILEAAELFAADIISKRLVQLTLQREFADAHLRFISVHGKDAPDRLRELLSESLESSEFPLMLNSISKAEFSRTVEYSSESFTETANIVNEFDLDGWFRNRRQEFDEDGWLDAKTIGEWPENPPQSGGLTGHLTARGTQPRKNVPIALLKLDGPWLVPAITGFGDWNEAPEPLVQSALFHRWYHRFSATIICQGTDFLECLIGSPPKDRESSMALAWEQFLFCPDIVDQGVGSIANLASVLLNSDYWLFWWD